MKGFSQHHPLARWAIGLAGVAASSATACALHERDLLIEDDDATVGDFRDASADGNRSGGKAHRRRQRWARPTGAGGGGAGGDGSIGNAGAGGAGLAGSAGSGGGPAVA